MSNKDEQGEIKLARKQKGRSKKLDTGTEYNIWYHKFATREHYDSRERSETRCTLAKDAGLTRGAAEGTRVFCLHFARGCCTKGPDCMYLHRIPTPLDDVHLSSAEDIFGRERHATDREDMGGVGSFTRENRTLYVGNIGYIGRSTLPMEEKLWEHFGEWGTVEAVRVIPSKNCAFVRYHYRSSAEFGKEAMSNQTLGDDVVINVRWAMEDPNPRAKEQIQQRMLETFAQAQVIRGHVTQEMVGNLPNADPQIIARVALAQGYGDAYARTQVGSLDHHSEEPIPKRQKLTDEQQYMQAQLSLSEGVYPDTNAQFIQAAPTQQQASFFSSSDQQQQLTSSSEPFVAPTAVNTDDASGAPATGEGGDASYAQQWYAWATQYYQQCGAWPTARDWEYNYTLQYYGASSSTLAENPEGYDQPIGPALPSNSEDGVQNTGETKPQGEAEGETDKAAHQNNPNTNARGTSDDSDE